MILNDNDMSIAPPVGAMSAYLSRLLSSQSFLGLRELAARRWRSASREAIERTARRAEEYARGMLTGGTLFEELGFYYVGPIDGHNLDHLLPVLRNVRDAEEHGPILLHVITQKGKGYAPAEAVGGQVARGVEVQRLTGEQAKAPPGPPTYTRVFADALIAEAEARPRRSSRSRRRCRRAPGWTASPSDSRTAASTSASPSSLFPALPIGVYRIEVTAANFQTAVVTDLKAASRFHSHPRRSVEGGPRPPTQF